MTLPPQLRPLMAWPVDPITTAICSIMSLGNPPLRANNKSLANELEDLGQLRLTFMLKRIISVKQSETRASGQQQLPDARLLLM